MITQILIYGTLKGSILAIIAVGFCLLFGVARMINLAHGTYYMLGAYGVYVFYSAVHLPLLAALALSVVVVGGIATLVDFAFLRWRRDDKVYELVFTVALALLVEETLIFFLGSHGRNVPSFVEGTTTFLGTKVPVYQFFIFGLSVGILSLLWLFMAYTSWGKAISAVSQRREAAIYCGIDPNVVIPGVVFISAGLAALAGGVISPILVINPYMWLFALIKAFAIVILGGLGNVLGSVLASFLLGYSEVAVAFTVSDALSESVSLMVIIVALLVRPKGLLGLKVAR